jgi:hypothetical protein
MRKLRIPLYTMPATSAVLQPAPQCTFVPLQHGIPIDCGVCTVTAWPVSHDAAAPIAVRVHDGVHSVAVATDLGTWDQPLVAFMQTADPGRG